MWPADIGMQIRSFIQSFIARWEVWTSPLNDIEPNTDTAWRSRLFASLMLVTGIALCGAVLTLLIASRITVIYTPAFAGLTISLAIVLSAYWLSRRGYFRVALGIVVVVGCLVIFMVCVGTQDYNTFYFMPVTLLFASPFINIRWTLILGALQFSLMAVYPLFVSYTDGPLIFEEPGIFTAVSLSIIAVTTAYRNYLERQRQGHLVRLIAERDDVQQALSKLAAEKEQQARLLDSILSATTDMIGVFDREGRLTYVNRTGLVLFGYELDDLIDRRPLEVNTIPGNKATWEELDTVLERAFKDGKGTMIELPAATSADHEKVGIYEAVVSPIRNGDNQVISVVIVARDITMRKHQEAEKLKLALEQERIQLMSRFFQAISHDFRTSLSIIEANRYLVSSDLNDESRDKTVKRLSHIQDSVLRMNTQIDNLSVLSSLAERHNTPFDLNSVVMNAVNFQTSASKRKNQQLSFEPALELPHAIGEAREIQRAVEFLINNATNFTDEAGRITVRTFLHYPQGNLSTPSQNVALSQNGVIEAVVEIRDTGIGIAEEHQQAIFDLFYRVDPARSLDSGGIGIGLSIAQVIVNMHGGRITVSSTPDVGSVFTIYLPTATIL